MSENRKRSAFPPPPQGYCHLEQMRAGKDLNPKIPDRSVSLFLQSMLKQTMFQVCTHLGTNRRVLMGVCGHFFRVPLSHTLLLDLTITN